MRTWNSIAYFSCNGYTVSIPLNDTQDYDIIVDKDGIIQTVQVKSTGCKRKNGNYQVALKSCGDTIEKNNPNQIIWLGLF